jgi:hypothetical protein
MHKEDTMITMKRVGLSMILAGAMLHSPLTLQAADPNLVQPPQKSYGMGPGGASTSGYGMPMMGGGGHMREPDMIYGYELMTPKERTDYMDRLHNAKTLDERDKIRNEHYQLMQERARKSGADFPGPCPGYYGPGGPGR